MPTSRAGQPELTSGFVGFRERILRMLDTGDAGLDSEQFVEFVVVIAWFLSSPGPIR